MKGMNMKAKFELKSNQPSYQTVCLCGQVLDYLISPFMTAEKRVCPGCGKIHYVDHTPVDWDKATGERKL